MKEKIAIAIAVVLIGITASACTRGNTDGSDTSSNRSDIVSNSSQDTNSGSMGSDLNSDKNGITSFVSSSMDAVDSAINK